MWRKTRSKQPADPNRNFNYHFAGNMSNNSISQTCYNQINFGFSSSSSNNNNNNNNNDNNNDNNIDNNNVTLAG